MGAGGALFEMQQNNKQVKECLMHRMMASSLSATVHRC
jgi:hypothetical protein